MNFEERHIDVVGLPTRYLRAGTTGPPLVLLHGFGDDAHDWQWVMPALARTHERFLVEAAQADAKEKPEREKRQERMSAHLRSRRRAIPEVADACGPRR